VVMSFDETAPHDLGEDRKRVTAAWNGTAGQLVSLGSRSAASALPF
jgi:hypothetical protein